MIASEASCFENFFSLFTLEFCAPPFARLKIAHFTRKLTYFNENLQSKWQGFGGLLLCLKYGLFSVWVAPTRPITAPVLSSRF